MGTSNVFDGWTMTIMQTQEVCYAGKCWWDEEVCNLACTTWARQTLLMDRRWHHANTRSLLRGGMLVA